MEQVLSLLLLQWLDSVFESDWLSRAHVRVFRPAVSLCSNSRGIFTHSFYHNASRTGESTVFIRESLNRLLNHFVQKHLFISEKKHHLCFSLEMCSVSVVALFAAVFSGRKNKVTGNIVII